MSIKWTPRVPSLLIISIFPQLVVLESTFSQIPTKRSIGGNTGVAVGPGTTVDVGVSVGVTVGGTGVSVGKGVDVVVGKARCVSATAVLTVAMAVSMISASLIVDVD
jgi:hypothetical protein